MHDDEQSHDEQEVHDQVIEINRIRLGVLEQGMASLGGIHPREGSMALICLAIELHLNGTNFTKDQVREALKDMIDFTLDHAHLVLRKDIN